MILVAAVAILVVGIGLGIAFGSESNKDPNSVSRDNSESKEEQVDIDYEPVPELDLLVTFGDMSFKINRNWPQIDGEDNFTYYYPEVDSIKLIMSYYHEFGLTKAMTEAGFDALFTSFLEATGGKALSINKSEVESLKNYPAYDAVLLMRVDGTEYFLYMTALFRSDASMISVFTFGVPEKESKRWQKVVDFVRLSIIPTESYIADEEVRAEEAKAAAEEAARLQAEESARIEAEKQAEQAAKQAAEQAEKDRIAKETVSQKNAVKMAKDYLNAMPFSRQGLIRQLEYEGFSNADATYGVDYSGANWMIQAEKMAQSYLKAMPFSWQGLINQLLYEGFSNEEAVHGVNSVGL
jgi:hypothetical protein